MCKKLIVLTSSVLVLALGGTNVVGADTIWEGIIKSNQDCVEQGNPTPSGGMDFGSSDLEFVDDGGIQTIGLRFLSVRVPAGASISRAYVVLTQEEVESDGPCNLVIHGHLTPNAPLFEDVAGNISTRPKTQQVVKWSPEHWPVDNTPHETSDISPIIEEIVSQAGWAEGNAIVLIFDQDPDNPSTTHRTVHKTATPDYEPLLHIEWSLGNATDPNPADEQTEVSIDTDLNWTAGVYAAASNGHTLYLSESFDDVNNGVGGITQTPTSYDPGRLNYGTTYYWRVRENNGAPNAGVNEGSVWSFTTEYYSYPIDGGTIIATASSVGQADFGPENTINGSGLNDNDGHSTDPLDMWLSNMETAGAWIQYEFDQVHKLHEMWVWNSNQAFESLFGFGLRDVTVEYSTDGADWTILADAPEFAQAPAPATNDYAHNTVVDFGGLPAKYVKLTANTNWGGVLPQYSLSEVRFFQIPAGATMPSPDSGAAGVEVDVVLGWRAGRGAVTHNVSVSADEQAVTDGTAPVAAAADASYIPPELGLSTSYYWNVGEVNEAETTSTWESGVWSFTTSDHVVVEDFESYNDIDPPDPASNRIFESWIDGFGVATNGALVGNDPPNPSYAETVVVHNGRQSMPMLYSNTFGATLSEATRTFAVPQDWTKHGATMLGLYFYGLPGNTGQMYVKINGTNIPYDGADSKLALNGWQLWTIDLASSGANLQSVSSLTIGIDGFGASGTLYFDDIRLYAVAPAPVNDWTISAGDNDAEEKVVGGGMDIGSGDLELGYEGAMAPETLQIVGCRWVAVTIPQGATITEAWVQFSADDINNPYHVPAVSVIVEGQLSPSPAVFTDAASDISRRSTTAASVVWDIPQWMTVDAQRPEERTPDISSIIQEIVNQPDWDGDAIVLMFRDNPANPSQGTRESNSFSAGPSEAPHLHISYQ